MRKPLFVAMTASATLLVGGGVAVAMAGQPTNATNTAVTRAETPAASTAVAQSRITAKQAQTIALRRTGGGRVASTELEEEHGRLVWKVEVRKGSARWRVDVDSATGLIVRVRSDQSGHRAARADDARGTHVDDRQARGTDDGARVARHGNGADDGPAHDVADDHGRNGNGADDGPAHDVGDDHGGRGGGHGDDHGGHGGDD